MKKMIVCASILCLCSGIASAGVLHLICDPHEWQLAIQSVDTWDRGDDLTLIFTAFGDSVRSATAWPESPPVVPAFWNGPIPCTANPANPNEFGDYWAYVTVHHIEFGWSGAVGWDWGPGVAAVDQGADTAHSGCGYSGGAEFEEPLLSAWTTASVTSPVIFKFVLGATSGGNIDYSTDAGVTFYPETGSQFLECDDWDVDHTLTGLSIGFVGFGDVETGGVYIDDVQVWQNGMMIFSDDFEGSTIDPLKWNVYAGTGGTAEIVTFGPPPPTPTPAPETGVSRWSDYR